MIAFSQTGTKNITTNKPLKDSIVQLPKNVAKAVVKDVIRKDSLEGELTISKKNEDLLKANILLKDSVIANRESLIMLYKEKEKNYMTMIDFKEAQRKNFEDLSNTLNEDLKKTRRELRLTKIGSAGVALFLGYLLVK